MLFQVLGPLRLLVGGREIPLGSRRRRSLLGALLVHCGEVVPLDTLMTALWGEDPPASARASLQSHVSRLRSALDEGVDASDRIVTRSSGYSLRLIPGDEVDAACFEQELEQGRRLTAEQPEAAVELLERALARWRGPAFADAGDGGLVRAEAVRLEELRQLAREERLRVLLALGRHASVVAELEALVREQPLRERPVEQLMVALYRSGRQADALQAFRAHRERLADELGVDPSPELAELHERVLRQDLSLRPPPEAAARLSSIPAAEAPGEAARPVEVPARPPRTPRPVLGRPPTSFVGRDDLLAGLAALLDRAPLLTLIGPGGVGKTRLAGEVTRDVADRFPDGVVTIELAPVREPDALEHALAASLGIVAGATGVRDRLVSALQDRRLLLLVDNCEHLLPAAAELVDDLLRRCPTLTILATSRERLAVDGEHLWPVPPLEVPPEDAAATVSGNAAVRLFCERAVSAAPTFDPGREDLADVARICRSLDGLPLALELAAARVAAMPLHDLAERLDERFRILRGGPRREGGRHRALHQVVEWSYDLLHPGEALLFDRLSVFLGGFTLAAAEEVCAGDGIAAGDVTAHLPALVDKSMVVHSAGRYRLLETLRMFGASRLEERGEAERLRGAHARYFAGFVEEAGQGLVGPDDRAWTRRLESELGNVRAAHRWALRNGEPDIALRLSAPLLSYGEWHLHDESLRWSGDAASMPDARGHRLVPHAFAAAARGALYRGQLEECVELARRGLDAAPDPDDPRRLLALEALCLEAFFTGRLEESMRLEAEVLRLAEQGGGPHNVVLALGMQALIAAYRHRAGDAARFAERACREADGLRNEHFMALSRYCRGEVLRTTAPDAALGDLEEAVELACALGARLLEGVALVSIGSLRARRGEPEAALDALRRTVEHWRRAGDWTHQWTALRNLLFLLVRLEQDEAAATLLGAVETTHTSGRVYGDDAEQLRHAAELLQRRLGEDRYRRARALGARHSDQEAVLFSLDTIDALQARLADGGSTR